MDLGSILLIIALFILTALYVALPLFKHKMPVRKSAAKVQGHDISALLAEHDQIINALRELDFDYSLKKIPEEDYPLQRNIMLNRGAEILRLLDEYQQRPPVKKEKVKKAAPGVPAAQPPAVSTGQDDEIETRIALRRRDRKEKAGGFCPKCGTPFQSSDRFCSKCGESLVG